MIVTISNITVDDRLALEKMLGGSNYRKKPNVNVRCGVIQSNNQFYHDRVWTSVTFSWYRSHNITLLTFYSNDDNPNWQVFCITRTHAQRVRRETDRVFNKGYSK